MKKSEKNFLKILGEFFLFSFLIILFVDPAGFYERVHAQDSVEVKVPSVSNNNKTSAGTGENEIKKEPQTGKEPSEYAKRAMEAYAANDMEKAIKICREGLEKKENDLDLHTVLAKVEFSRKNYLRAFEEFSYVLRHRIVSNEINEELSKLKEIGRAKYREWLKYKEKGDMKAGQPVLFEAFRLDSGLAREHPDEFEAAVYYWQLYSSNTTDAAVLYRLGSLYEISGEVELASENYALMLDYLEDKIEQICIIDRYAFLNKTDQEKALEAIRKFTEDRAQFEKELEESTAGMTEEERAQFKSYIDSQASIAERINAAETEEEKKALLEEAIRSFMEQAKSGQLPPAVQKQLEEESARTGKSVEQLMQERGFKLK